MRYSTSQIAVWIKNCETVLNWYAMKRAEWENTKWEQRIIDLNFQREKRLKNMMSSSKNLSFKYL